MAGHKITQKGDQLNPITVERLYQLTVSPDSDHAPLVQQLRSMRTLNPDAYRRNKTGLPYVVAGQFTPPARLKENFAYTEHFILDVDKLTQRDLTPQSLRELLSNDDRIVLLFASPGFDGIKLLFNLSQRIHDPAYYSQFYKLFAANFARQYGLTGLVDTVTSDVSRCCFLSCDPDAVYRPQAQPVEAHALLDPNDPGMLDRLRDELQEAEDMAPEPEPRPELSSDTITAIKQRINPAWAARSRQKAPPNQPIELEEAMPCLTAALAADGIRLTDSKPIQYGRQLRLTAGTHWAEVNLYYGKRGFRAVPTTKTGSHAELAELCTRAIQLYLDQGLHLQTAQTDPADQPCQDPAP